MTTMRVKICLAGVLMGVGVLLGGCGGDDGEPPTATPTPTATMTGTPTATVEPTATATPSLAEIAEEVAAAYEGYIEAYREAVLHLDIALVEDYVAGDELESIQNEIDQLRADGVALRVVTEHDFVVVDVSENSAIVSDDIVDNTFYVDAETLEPEEAEGAGESFRDLVMLEQIDGRWVVVGGSRSRGGGP